MTPSLVAFKKMVDLLGADTITFAGTLSVGLIKTPFSPSLNMSFVAGDEANFTGYAFKTLTAATRPTANDPATGDRLLTITPPVGGFVWETTGTTNLPQTIYGYYVGADTIGIGGTLLGAALLDAPVVLTATDQQVQIPDPQLRVNPAAIS